MSQVTANTLPVLSPDDVEALLVAQPTKGLAIAPDMNRSGTTAVAVAPIGAVPFCFGAGSFLRYRHAADRRGLETVVVERPGLSFDVDSPEALSRWRELDLVGVRAGSKGE